MQVSALRFSLLVALFGGFSAARISGRWHMLILDPNSKYGFDLPWTSQSFEQRAAVKGFLKSILRAGPSAVLFFLLMAGGDDLFLCVV